MKRKRRHITKKRRNRILRRDGYKCRYCGVSVIKEHHLDHVTPIRWGGNDWSTNLVSSCITCNMIKKAHYWKPEPLSILRLFYSGYLIFRDDDYPKITDFI